VTPFSRAKSWVNETIAIPYPKKNDMYYYVCPNDMSIPYQKKMICLLPTHGLSIANTKIKFPKAEIWKKISCCYSSML
jgi:hypothetical protein